MDADDESPLIGARRNGYTIDGWQVLCARHARREEEDCNGKAQGPANAAAGGAIMTRGAHFHSTDVLQAAWTLTG
jgi:hypothetical protein